jgi:hypothetical protein
MSKCFLIRDIRRGKHHSSSGSTKRSQRIVHLQRASNFFGPRSEVAGNNRPQPLELTIIIHERTRR